METIQIALFFTISYLLSRVFVKFRIPELIIYYLFEKRNASIQQITLMLIMGATLISTVILNIITVLTLMPLVVLLQNEFKSDAKKSKKINTLFLLAVLWGANIGGLGTVTGTTTNGVLIGFYDLYNVPYAENFTFISWAAWGVPLIILLSLLGWLILLLIFKPGRMVHRRDFSAELESKELSLNLQKTGIYHAIAFVLTASTLSFLLGALPDKKLAVIILTAVWTIVFLYLFFVANWKTESGEKVKLLVVKDILHGVPKRGLLWMSAAIVVTYVLWQLKLHNIMADWFTVWMETETSIISIYLIFAMLTTFLSELVSNTAVQFTMFLVVFPLVALNPEWSWQIMLVTTLCSSCAFMTPLATPSNGLGFGSSGKVSLGYMFFSGFIMNIISALFIVGWVHYVVPVVLRLFF